MVSVLGSGVRLSAEGQGKGARFLTRTREMP